MAGGDDPPGFASPPCYAHELDPAYRELLAEAPAMPAEVRRWRRAERERLRAERRALGAAERRRIAGLVADHLERLLACWLGSVTGRRIAVWWPIDGELNLRPLFAAWHAHGAVLALPVVVEPKRPLHFHRWTPTSRMQPGYWNVPVPAAGEPVAPEVVLAPLVGFDAACHRLGHGGGYYDRTLATVLPKPIAVGVGPSLGQLATIRPQPHDVPMGAIVTEAGVLRPG